MFLRNGYLGTSMDEVAALAAVSKQTVYKHFADKESLFSEIVTGTVDEVGDPNTRRCSTSRQRRPRGRPARPRAPAAPRVMQPRVLQLRRLVIGEAGRFPQLGRSSTSAARGARSQALAEAFERLAPEGKLKLDDPALAAAHFNWLVMSIPLNQAMLLGEDEQPDLDRYADEGVRVFLAAYGA